MTGGGERKQMKELQRLLSGARRAVQKYSMIDEGDLVAVGVSGGKDSLALLCVLAALREFYPVSFELCALTVDPGFDKADTIAASPFDFSQIEELCRRLRVPFFVRKTLIAPLVFDHRREKNPCSLCANMRRGALIDLAKEKGASKLALGHHMEDAAETVVMNLFDGGRFGCFSPLTQIEDREISVIRPMILCRESEIARFAKKAALPVEKSPCPMDAGSNRAEVKALICSLDRKNPGVVDRLVGALCRAEVDGWHN